jgi:signal transduction histidine kinase
MMLLSGAKTSVEFSRLRIDEIIWQVIENAFLYYEANVEVELKVEDTKLLEWQGNDKLLALAINNIVENAIKYSNNKPVKIIIHEIAGKLQVIVKDKGIGITGDDLKKVKQNFYRGKNTGKYSGKGIGLSMANIILNLHKIELEIQSQPTGTEVKLNF